MSDAPRYDSTLWTGEPAPLAPPRDYEAEYRQSLGKSDQKVHGGTA